MKTMRKNTQILCVSINSRTAAMRFFLLVIWRGEGKANSLSTIYAILFYSTLNINSKRFFRYFCCCCCCKTHFGILSPSPPCRVMEKFQRAQRKNDTKKERKPAPNPTGLIITTHRKPTVYTRLFAHTNSKQPTTANRPKPKKNIRKNERRNERRYTCKKTTPNIRIEHRILS